MVLVVCVTLRSAGMTASATNRRLGISVEAFAPPVDVHPAIACDRGNISDSSRLAVTGL